MKIALLNRFSDNDETIPVVVNFDCISFFYPWDGRNKGTFIAFGGGDAIVVKESFDDILDTLKRHIEKENLSNGFRSICTDR